MTGADGRAALAAALALLILLVVAVSAAEPYSPEDTFAAIAQAAEAHQVSEAWLTRVVGCETGHLFNPDALGDGGSSHGVAQLNDWPTGLLGHFMAQGYTDPYDPYQATDYMARAFAGDWEGEGIGWWRWSCR